MNKNIFNDDFNKIYLQALESIESYKRDALTSDILLIEMFKSYGTTARYVLTEYGVTLEELLEEFNKIIVIHRNNSNISLLDELFDYCFTHNSKKEITETDIFMSFLRYKNCIANSILEKLGIDTDEAYLEVTDMLNLDNIYPTFKKDKNISLEFTSNLTELYKQNKLNPFYGRKNYINRIHEVLERKNKNNPLLIGNAGVGKSSLIEGLAKYYFEENKDIEILSLNLTSILSGTKYRGDFEKKLEDIIKLIENNNKYILFIDEIHNIISTGSSEGSLDCANILKPILTKGNIKIIGATTLDEYYKYFESDKALSRRFQNIYIEEPNTNEVRNILINIKSSYENFHNINISNKMIDYLINESNHRLPNKKFPDKAIDILDEVLTSNKLKNKKNVDYIDIDNSISKMLGVNNKTNINFEFKELKPYYLLFSLNLYNNRNNICSILFNGNKNGLNYLKNDILQGFNINNDMTLNINLNNYNEPFSASSLTGSPKGYVGYDDGGLLYNHILKHPISLIIFNNFSNASIEIKRLIESLLNTDKIIDFKGREINLNNCIFIIENNDIISNKRVGFINNDMFSNSLFNIKTDLIINCNKDKEENVYTDNVIKKIKNKGYILNNNKEINSDNLVEILKEVKI